jgi:hypothetical protein
VQPHQLAQAQLTVVSRKPEHDDLARLADGIRRAFAETAAHVPALKEFQLAIVGLAPMHAKMAQGLVPTLVESFLLTVAIIFTAFFVIFRSGTARLMAMIPSLFAILVMFLVMRLTGMELNIATILIASTVLGTSENDQIHFFYHFLEGRKDGDVEPRRTLLVMGRSSVRDPDQRRRLRRVRLGRPAADRAVRHARGAGVRAVDDRRLHGVAGGVVDPVSREAGRPLSACSPTTTRTRPSAFRSSPSS